MKNNLLSILIIAILGGTLVSCDDGDTMQNFQLGNKTNKEVIVEYQYSETELRIIKVPSNGYSSISHERSFLPDYKLDDTSIEIILNKLKIFYILEGDTVFLPKNEYISASKWVRIATYDMSTTSAFYTLVVDSIMFTKK